MSDAVRRALRTFLQLIAAGGLTALVAAIVNGLTATVAGIVLAASQVVVTYVQNLLEDAGTIPPVLGTKTDQTS